MLTEPDLPVKLRCLEISFEDGDQKKFTRLLREAVTFGDLEKLAIRPPFSMEGKKDAVLSEALMANPHLATVQDLEICDLKFSDKAVKVLVETDFSQLRRLDLNKTNINNERLATFMKASWLPGLKYLALREYPKKPDYTALKAMFADTASVCVAY